MERMKEEEQEKEKSERTDRFRRASAFGLAPRPSISASQADSGRRRSLFPTPQDGGAESVASRGTRGSIVDGTKRGLATTTGALSARSAPQSARTGPGGQRLSLTMTIPQVQDSSTPPRRRPSSARPAAVSSASPAMFSQSSQHNGPPGDPSVVLLSPNQRPSTSPAHVARREGGGVPPSSQQLEVPSADGQGSIQGQTGETKRQSLLAASEAGDSVAQVEQRATGQQCSEAAEGLTEAESVDLDVKFDRCGGLEGREEGPSDAHPQPLRAHPHPQFPSKLYESNHDAVVVAVKRDPKSESDTEVMAVGTAVFDRIKNFEASALNLSGNAADVEPQTAVEELGRGVRLCYEDAGSFILQLKGRNAAELVKGKTTPNGAAGGASGFSPRGSVGKRGDTRLGAAVDWEDEGGRDRAGTMFGGGSHPFSPTPGGTPMTSTRPVPLSSLFPHSVSLSPSGRPQSGASRRLQAPPAPPGSTASSRLDVRAARVNPTETGSVDPGPLNAAAATAAAAAAAVAAADSPAEAAGEEYRERVPLREREPTRPLEGGRAAREDGERSHPVLREDDLPPISLGQSRLASSTGKERDARAP
uniref:Uncharacterized protein n=1 Tax=Chromera velia CCMP2878 TaxID=1169474 RepID=A0A0G4F9G8_9ALVE|eukprot:Cvel_15733.t1-p1 / transcript=Cvel_15733.t1 / gene=Cvel_15733 / organism=Chromera_velia_CCMP2878 / gene_product=hypothetical protein / transcript_product=hypothetical protein / location=Cvel_scaffold1176:49945-53086(-) / protein_length=588 / sequence_SO=supercontig / SO=protein_coding / is_pseudo=false